MLQIAVELQEIVPDIHPCERRLRVANRRPAPVAARPTWHSGWEQPRKSCGHAPVAALASVASWRCRARPSHPVQPLFPRFELSSILLKLRHLLRYNSGYVLDFSLRRCVPLFTGGDRVGSTFAHK